MLTIEFEMPVTQACECCGGTSTRLTRFVSQDGNAFAIYFVEFSDNHPDRLVKLLVTVGEWGEDANPSTRSSFALDLRPTPERFEVMVTDAAFCPWRDSKLLGHILDREEGLRHPRIKDVFHVIDHAVAVDLPLKAYLHEKT